MKLKHVALVVCIILSLSFIRHIDSAWSSEIVYPLLYGPGTWDLFINDIASFSAGDILIGGKSFSTKAAGEGFVMRIDKYGKIFWQKIYQSSATGEDSIDKVAVSNDYSFAVGHSLTGSANTYFLLKLGSDGSVLYNAQVGGLSTLVGTDSIITNLVPVSDSSANVYYDGTVGGVHYVSGSYVVMDGTTAESVMGLKNVAVSTTIIQFIIICKKLISKLLCNFYYLRFFMNNFLK